MVEPRLQQPQEVELLKHVAQRVMAYPVGPTLPRVQSREKNPDEVAP